MRLKSTSQYAIRILYYISTIKDERLCSATELSDKLNIPYKFLTKIMTQLVKSEFIDSIRGREGGYQLSRPASQITLKDILDTFNECEDENSCILGIGLCDNKQKCALHDQWIEPKGMIKKMFENTTLETLTTDDFKL